MRNVALFVLLLGCAPAPRTVPPSAPSVASTGSETEPEQGAYVEPAPAEPAPAEPALAEPRPVVITPAPTPIAEPTPSEPAPPTATPSTPSQGTTPTNSTIPGITATSSTSWTISEEVWDEMMRDALSLARIVPETQGSQTVGYRLAGIRASTRLTQLGLANGDIIQSVNGVALTSIAAALSVATQRNASDFRIEFLRDGAPRVHEYHVLRP